MRVVLWISLGVFPVLIHTSDWANVGWKVSGLLEGIFNAINDDSEIEPGPTNLPALFRKAGGIAKFMGVVGPTFALLTVLLPGDHQFEEIMAQFEIVNQELGKLGRDMENLEEQLKYQHAKTQIHGDFVTMELACDLFATYSNISNSEIARNTSRDSLILMETDLMQAISSVIKGQNGENEFASTNLFESIYSTTNGDLMYLSMVSDTIHGTVVNSILAYHSVIYMKYSEDGEDDDMCEERAQEACNQFDEDMEKMQNLMANFLELCEKDSSSNVLKEIDDIVDNHGHNSYETLGKILEAQLGLKYYWLDFVVIVYPGRNPRDYVHSGYKYYRKYQNNEIVVMFKEVADPSKLVETQWLYDKVMGSFGCWIYSGHYHFCSYDGRTKSSEIHSLLQRELKNAGIEDFGISVVQLEWKRGKIGPVFSTHSNIGSSVYTKQSDGGWFQVTVALKNAHTGSTSCPISHPYLYNYGQGCCKESTESGSENYRPPCNQGAMSYTSRCCENSFNCTSWGGCRSCNFDAEQWELQWACRYKECEYPILCIIGECDWVPTYVKKIKPCQVPFTYKGIEFGGCTTMDNSDIPWCATKTKNGEYVDGEWGECSESCMQSSEEEPMQKIIKADANKITEAECKELEKQCVR